MYKFSTNKLYFPYMSEQEEVITGEKESAEELIIQISKRVSGVTNGIAGTVATDFTDLSLFLAADETRLSRICNSAGMAILSDDQISALIKEKGAIPRKSSLQEAWVFYLGRTFLLSQVETIRRLSLQSFDINPLLAKALNLDTPRKVIAFNVYQTVTRSVVTAWGSTIERIARFVGCRDNDYILSGGSGTNFDLVKTIGDVDYYIQVKSGPNTMNVGMVTSLNRAIRQLESKKENAKGVLGMTYGTRPRISAQITTGLKGADTRMKVGREFWDFVSEKKDFHKDLFRLLDVSAADLLADSFIELIEAKITEIETAWTEANPDKSVDDLLGAYI